MKRCFVWIVAAVSLTPAALYADPAQPPSDAVVAQDRYFEQLESLTVEIGPDRAAPLIEHALRMSIYRLHTQDFNGDGAIGPREPLELRLQQIANQQGPEVAARWRADWDREHAKQLEQYDRNGDGRVSQYERFYVGFERTVNLARTTENPELRERYQEYARQYSDRYDADNDGHVSEAEYEQTTRRPHVANEDAWRHRRMLYLHDTDRDGTLSKAEKQRMIDKQRAAAKAQKQRNAATIKRYDSDGDGSLSPAEVKKMRDEAERLIRELRDIETLARVESGTPGHGYEGALRTIRLFRYHPSLATDAPAGSDPGTKRPLTGQ